MSKFGKIAVDAVLFTMLAGVCVGTAEMIFCYHRDPALFARLASPLIETLEESKDKAVEIEDYLEPETAAPPAASVSESAAELPADTSAPVNAVELNAVEDVATQLASKPLFPRNVEYADASVTSFKPGRYTSVLTGGSVPLCYYNQGDEAWASCPFGTDTVDKYGCGPTAMAMVVSSLSDQVINPADMALWAAEQGYACPGHGSYHSIVPNTSAYFGLSCESLANITADELRERLSGGGLMVALVVKGHFTSNGHYIILHGVTEDGKILVADPNSRENSLMTWDAQLILDELSPARDSGAPLWLVTSA